MTKTERMRATLAGKPTDRVPRALWRHYPHEEFKREEFVAAVVGFHQRHDFDIVKIGPRSSFGIRDLGAQDVFDGDYLGRPQYQNEVIQNPADWAGLKRVDPREGWMGHTAGCVAEICANFDETTPRIVTVFSPATQAKNLAGIARFKEHWRQHPQALRAGLEILAANTVAWVQSLAAAKVDGLFFAVQECGLPDLQPGYLTMCGDLDRAVLTAGDFWLNVLHLHGKILDFDAFAQYPAAILHWDESEAGITLAEGRQRFPGIVSGGVDWPAAGWESDESVRAAAQTAVKRCGVDRLFLSAGCVIPHQTNPARIEAFCGFDD